MTTVSASTASLTLSTHPATVAVTTEFAFPTIDGYSAGWNIDPLDKVFFYAARTETDQAVYGSDGTQHANPVQADRFGNLPTIKATADDYSVWVANRYGVIKYQATEAGGTWSVGQGFVGVSAGTATLDLNTHAATVTLTPTIIVSATTATLNLATHAATVSLSAGSSGYVAYTPPAVEDFDYSAYGAYTPPAVEDFDYS